MSANQGLKSAWDKVKGYMDEYGDLLLCINEEQTRYTLVDPILRALGWDLENPNQVKVEYRDENNEDKTRPDYTFFKKGKKGKNEQVLIVEAKKWGFSGYEVIESTEEFNKLKDYCENRVVKFGALTDGGSWWVYKFDNKRKPKKLAFVDADDSNEKADDINKLKQYIGRQAF
jgi:predicted type IV restriction endonuclease